MIKKKEHAIYRAAHHTYGISTQVTVALEELAELQQEVCKMIRGRGERHHMAEEIADALIVIEQLMLISGISYGEVQKVRVQKLVRLVKRMAKDTKKTEKEMWEWIKTLENT